MAKNILLSMVFLLSSGANKAPTQAEHWPCQVLLRILLVLVSDYAFMLGVLTNLLYITTFGLQFMAPRHLKVRTDSPHIGFRDMCT